MLLSDSVNRVKHHSVWLLSLLLIAPEAFGERAAIRLPGDALTMVEVHGPGTASRLAVMTVAQAHPWGRRAVTYFAKQGDKLSEVGTVPLWSDAAAVDVCRLDPASPESTLVVARP